MADMNLRMTLTLADVASGPLRGFIGLMEQLRGIVNGMGRLDSTALGIGAISRASAGADRNVAGFTGALMGMEAALNGVAGRLSSVAAGMMAVGTEGRAAGAGVMAGTTAMTAGMAGANAQASTLMTTLRAMGQLYVAAKIKDGLVASATGAIEYEKSRTRAGNMGMTESEQATLIASAKRTVAEVPQFDRRQALDMAIDLKNFMNSVEGAAAILPQMAKLKVNLDAAGLKPDRDVFVNIGKLLQQRNAISGPALEENVDMIGRIVTYTQGRVDVAKLTQSIQAMRATGQTVENEFLPALASMIEASGGKNVVGAALFQAEKYVMGNIKDGLAASEAMKWGMLDPKKVVWNENTGDIDLKRTAASDGLRMRGAELWQSNPFEFAKFMLEQLKSRGVTDEQEIIRIANRMFPSARAGEGIVPMLTQARIIQGDVDQTARVLPQQEQFNRNMQTADQRLAAVKGQLRDLGIVLGETFLPAIKKVADGLVGATRWLTAFFEAHPVAASLATWSLAFGAVVLAIGGLIGIFGIALGSITGFMARILQFGTSLFGIKTAAEVGMGGAAGATTTFGGSIIGVFLRLIGQLGLLLLAWNIGQSIGGYMREWLRTVEVGGTDILSWALGWGDRFVTAIQNAWIRAKVFFGLMSSAAAEAEIAGNKSDLARRLDANSDGVVKPKVGGAGGSWDTPFLETGGGTFRKAAGAGGSWDEDDATKKKKQEDDDAAAGRRGGRRARGGGTGRTDDQSAIRDTGSISSRDFVGPIFDQSQIDELAAKRAVELEKIELQVKRDLLTTAGQRRAAEAARIQAELEGNLQLLLQAGKINEEQAANARARAAAAIELKEIEVEEQARQETHRALLLKIDAEERNGLISDLEASRQRIEANKAEAASMDELLTRKLAAAKGSDNEVEAARIRTSMAQNTATLGQLPSETTQVLGATRRGFEDFFSSLMNGTKSAKQAFRDLGQSIMQAINDIVAKKLANQLFSSLFGDTGGGGLLGSASGGTGIFDWLGKSFGSGGGAGSQGLGGIFQSLFGGGNAGITGLPSYAIMPAAGGGDGLTSWLSGIFGGGATAGAGGGWLSTIGSFFGGFFADGIDYVPRDMLAVIHEGERVVTAKDNASWGRNSQGPLIGSMNFHVPSPTDHRSQQQLAAMASAAVQRANARGR